MNKKKIISNLFLGSIILSTISMSPLKALIAHADSDDDSNTYDTSTLPQSQKQFLDSILPYAMELSNKYGLYPSVMIAQAALESNWGQSGLSAQYNNLFGVKGSYNGSSVNMGTQEDYGSGLVNIVGGFRSYPSWKESLEDYAQLLRNGISGNSSFYSGAWKENTNSYKDVTAFLQGKYATATNYTTSLNGIIQTYGLDALDDKDNNFVYSSDDSDLSSDDDNTKEDDSVHYKSAKLDISPLTISKNSKKPTIDNFQIKSTDGSQIDKSKLSLHDDKLDTSKEGTYDVKITYNDNVMDVPVIVIKDANDKSIDVYDQTIQKGTDNFNKYSVVKNLSNNFQKNGTKGVSIDGDVDSNKVGDYPLTVNITNSNGILTTKQVVVHVVDNITNGSPTINSYDRKVDFSNIHNYADLLNAIAPNASDANGNKVNNFALLNYDLHKPGFQTLDLKATDSDGRTTVQTIGIDNTSSNDHLTVINDGATVNPSALFNNKDLPVSYHVQRSNTKVFTDKNGKKYTLISKEDPNYSVIKTTDISLNDHSNFKNFVSTNNTNAVSIVGDKDLNVGKNDIIFNINNKKINLPVYVKSAAPVIEGDKINVVAGSMIEPSRFMSAHSKTDGDISNKIKVDTTNVNLNKIGDYSTTASVQDKFGNISTKNITIHIIPNKPSINIPFKQPSVSSKEDLDKVLGTISSIDSVDGNLTKSIKFNTSSVNLSHRGVYTVTYSVTNSNNQTVKGNFKVGVTDIKKGETEVINNKTGKIDEKVNRNPQITPGSYSVNAKELVPDGTQSWGEKIKPAKKDKAIDIQNTPTN